jgi:hypothetical protein
MRSDGITIEEEKNKQTNKKHTEIPPRLSPRIHGKSYARLNGVQEIRPVIAQPFCLLLATKWSHFPASIAVFSLCRRRVIRMLPANRQAIV